ncbi:hypothetical protein EDF57_11444 [Novosphingobium sp. PhB55]|uniref:hypothetical protein n=1 Tax=Novosphingobium sp. PhB55 TaxID=2485106 RepID=UPI001066C499|nr:hypothetical protein [Novosphingobium sp. PhB55]TDW59262.1 hypothetical protein EDF57_11444 [Novosphingobium sp. PhB55]
MSFDVRSNPFALLGVSTHATRDAISRAFPDRKLVVDTAEHARQLEVAWQSVFSSRDRLAAEFAYVLELSDLTRARCFSHSTAGSRRLSPSAQACPRSLEYRGFLNELFETYAIRIAGSVDALADQIDTVLKEILGHGGF